MKSKCMLSILFLNENSYVKTYYLYFITGLFFSFSGGNGYAQPGNLISRAQKINKISFDERRSSKYFAMPENAPETRLNDININAVRHFTLFFEKPLHVKWYKVPGAFIAYFTSDSIKKMAAYNNRGIWVHTLSYYNEHKLPGYVRHLLKSVYYDYIINQVVQVEEDNQLVYMIQMEDAASFITVAVEENEMKIVKTIRK